ncbi:MAG: hypothetical protein GX066_08225 [Clostridiaceae bacterium]|nr:hypothetical protein [Clostridiaceae bacterium]
MKPILVLLLFFTMLLTGCWDRKDIESRGYVIGVAIDKYPPNPMESEKNGEKEATQEEEEN